MTVPNEDAVKAAATNETKSTKEGEEKPSQSGDAFSKEKALEFIGNLRKERQAEASDSASGDGAQSKPAETDKSAAAKEGESTTEGGKENEEGEESPKVFTAEDIAKPGFFDRLSKEEWKDLEKQHPATVAAYKAAQAELTRRGQKLAEKERAIEQREKSIETSAKTKSTTSATTDDQDKELEALGFSGEDVEKLLGSKAGKKIIGEAVQQTLQSMGIDPDKASAQQEGFDLALNAYPDLRDDEVWSEVQKVLEADPEEMEALETSTSKREIARILKAAAGKVVSSRAGKTREKTERDVKKVEKETKNATQPASKAVGAPRKPASVDTSKLSQRERMLEFIKDEKIKKQYKELR